MEEDRRKQERERLQLEREEKMLAAAREEEAFRRELEERKQQHEDKRRNYELELRKAEEEHQRALEERREQRLAEVAIRMNNPNRNQSATTARSGSTKNQSDARTLFGLFKSMKSKYKTTALNYFCDLVTKTPNAGVVTRCFENFKADLTKPGVIYTKFPIDYLDNYQSPSDRKVLLSLIDAQDENGFTALHWAVFRGQLRQIENLLAKGASTEVRTFVNKDLPCDKIQSGFSQSAIHELFRKYADIKKNNIAPSEVSQATKEQSTKVQYRDPSPFPFLELPLELQFIILEQLSIGTMLTVRCVCKYFKALQLSNNHVIELPDMGEWKFVDPPVDGYRRDKQCRLTIMATPTIYHYGLITGRCYQSPLPPGSVFGLQEMIERIARFANEDAKFHYDLDKLKGFLENTSQSRRTYFLQADKWSSQYTVYVELDASFGVGIDFYSPGDPMPIQENDDW